MADASGARVEASALELYAQIEGANAPPLLRQPLRQAVEAIQAALRLYGPERLLLSFNGGKDATVLLHLARAVYAHAGLAPPRCVYWDDDACFPQVAAFVEDAVQRYSLPLLRYSCGFTDGLRDAVDRHAMAAVLLGTRTCDPNGVGADAFQPSSAGWPTFMRVNPLLHWAYHDVWRFLRGFNLPFCELYERGYTSLGNMHNTRPNPALMLPSGAYLPADALPSAALERGGRGQEGTPPEAAVLTAGQLVVCAGAAVGHCSDAQSKRAAHILDGYGRTRLTRVLMVPGSEADIADAVRGLVARCDVVLVTDGGSHAFAGVAAAYSLKLVACDALGGARIPECAEPQPAAETRSLVTLRLRSSTVVFDNATAVVS